MLLQQDSNAGWYLYSLSVGILQASLLLQRRRRTEKQRDHNSITFMVEKIPQDIDISVHFDGSETEVALPNPPETAQFETADHVGAGFKGFRINILSEMYHHRGKECGLAVMRHRLTMDLPSEYVSPIWKACWSLVSVPEQLKSSCLATKVLPTVEKIYLDPN